MKLLFRFAAVAALALGPWAAPQPASAANLDTLADQIYGQPNFSSGTGNNGGLSAGSLFHPASMALDAQGNLYVADQFNHRVLVYNQPLTTDHIADRVFGQPNFTSGTGNNGGVSASSLYYPSGVALDAQGNLYVADNFNHRVLEYDAPLTSDAAADRVFGQPNFTSNTGNNGGLSASSLLEPIGVALDAQGNLYVADSDNNRVLEYNQPLTTDRTADHVFGQPNFTSDTEDNGGLSASSLDLPYSVMLDIHGNLYVADYGNNRVLAYNQPLTTDRTADHVFGQPNFTSDTEDNGGLSASSLRQPLGVALDAQGNLYVVEFGNNRVLEYDAPLTSDAVADRVFGQPNFTSNTENNGGHSAGSLFNPHGVAMDALGNLYVADFSNNRVLRYDVPVAHALPTLAMLGPSTVAAGSPALALTVNGANFVGNSVVRLNGSNRPTTYVNSTRLIVALTAADVVSGGPFAVTVFTPAPGGGTTTLINLPLYARLGEDALADVVQGQPNFTVSTANNPLLTTAQRLNQPVGVAVHSPSGRLFVVDRTNNRVLSWPNAPAFANGQPADLVIGQPDFFASSENTGGLSARGLRNPVGVAVDAAGNLYVGDASNHRVLEYDAPLSSGMAASRVFGQGGSFTTGLDNNGGVSANSLSFPEGVALDGQGNLFVADTNNNRVLEYDTPLSSGTTADRVFGQPGFGTNAFNNGGLGTGLGVPNRLALDEPGNLYVSDLVNNRVLEYDAPLSTGMTPDRVFGQPDLASNTANNGGLSASSLSGPGGLAVDKEGSLYVADTINNRVLAYDEPLSGSAADRVFGQPGFVSSTANNGGRDAGSLYAPNGLALNAVGGLFVADFSNHRVLVYDPASFVIFLPLVVR